MDRWKARELK
jgi:hypothetical protein